MVESTLNFVLGALYLVSGQWSVVSSFILATDY